MSDEEYIEVTCLDDRIRRYVAAARCSKGYMVKTYETESFVRPFVDNTAEILKEAKIGTVLLIALALSLSAVIAQLAGVF